MAVNIDELFASIYLSQPANADIEEQFNILQLSNVNFHQSSAVITRRCMMLHVLEGEGSFSLANEEYVIEPSTIYFTFPDNLLAELRLRKVSGILMVTTTDLLFQVNPNLLELSLFQEGEHRHQIALTEEFNGKMYKLAKEIDQEHRGSEHLKDKIIQRLLDLHIMYAERYYSKNPDKRIHLHQKVKSFLGIVNKSETGNLRVTDIAKDLAVSPNYLNELVQGQIGKSPKTIIKQKQIRKASALLLHSNLGLKEIAFKMGYKSPQYFNQDFKNATGLSPSEYRGQHLQFS